MFQKPLCIYYRKAFRESKPYIKEIRFDGDQNGMTGGGDWDAVEMRGKLVWWFSLKASIIIVPDNIA